MIGFPPTFMVALLPETWVGREGPDVQFAIQAAAKGVAAAVGINKQLMEEDRKRR